MMDIPTFKSSEHETEYYQIFDEHLATYKYIFDRVKEEFYGTGFGNASNLPGTCFTVLNDITRSIMYESSLEFRDRHPEYKSDADDIFIPRKGFKETLNEFVDELRQSSDLHNYTLGDK